MRAIARLRSYLPYGTSGVHQPRARCVKCNKLLVPLEDIITPSNGGYFHQVCFKRRPDTGMAYEGNIDGMTVPAFPVGLWPDNQVWYPAHRLQEECGMMLIGLDVLVELRLRGYIELAVADSLIEPDYSGDVFFRPATCTDIGRLVPLVVKLMSEESVLRLSK